MLLSITRSFKSASTSSLLVIPNLLPINLTIFELSAHRLISCEKNSFSPSSLNTIESVFASCDLSISVDKRKRFFSPDFPPWSYQKSNFEVISLVNQDPPLLSIQENGMTIWTRAMKLKSGVGITIVSCSTSAGVHSQQAKLPDYLTIEQAHSHALNYLLHSTIQNP